MMVINVRRNQGRRDRFQRMRETGLLTIEEVAERFGIVPSVVKDWRDKGLLQSYRYNDKGQCLYDAWFSRS
ncbi:MAG: MerR family transcriptional regulator [Terriglobia bacterium]